MASRRARRLAQIAAAAVFSAACARLPPTAGPAPPIAAPAGAPTVPATSAAPAVPPARFGPEPRIVLAPSEVAALEVVDRRLASRSAAPAMSGALVIAARDLARRAAEGEPEPLGQAARRAALTAGLAYDPAPAAYLVRGPADRIGPLLSELLPADHATHVGAGAAEVEGGVVMVVLAAERRARLDPFPRELPAGGAAVLSGRLAAGLLHPRVVVSVPSGDVREAEVRDSRGAFEAHLAFPAAGGYLVEVIAQGRGGPEVAALLAVSAGPPSRERPAASRGGAAEPEDAPGAEAAVVRAIGALRARRGLGPVTASPELSAVARAHSAAMLAQGKVSHVLPGSGALVDRLRRARVPYRRAYENVARGGSALAAHEAAEESPAHLANLLARGVARVGVGIARGPLPSGGSTVYLTEILIEPVDDGAESRLTPDARVREAIWAERARAGRAPLTADAALDDLARAAAADLLRRDATDAADLDDRALALGRRLAAVDVFVASAPADAARSANLRDGRFRRVGVGVATGDSARFGPGRMFVAVLYTD
jgi:uncharacterized protein YkwD